MSKIMLKCVRILPQMGQVGAEQQQYARAASPRGSMCELAPSARPPFLGQDGPSSQKMCQQLKPKCDCKQRFKK